MTLEWAHPWALLLLLLLPAYAGWLRRRGPRALPLPRADRLAVRAARSARLLGALPELLRALTLALLVLALARPRSGASVEERVSEGVPIVLALDLSSSMLAEDFQLAERQGGAPRARNRLEVARHTLAEFVAGREDDPIGLVAFAGEALTQVPLTTDYRVLRAALRGLRVGLLEDGTAIGDGLATAVNRVRRVPAASPVVVLLSDGESNRGEIDPLQAAAAARALGVRVYTVGVGSEGRARVPVRSEGGDITFVEAPVGVDEALLREIARLTGGVYFRATDPDALRDVFTAIDRLVPSRVEVRRYTRYREWYLPLVWLAVALLLAEWALRASRWGRLP